MRAPDTRLLSQAELNELSSVASTRLRATWPSLIGWPCGTHAVSSGLRLPACFPWANAVQPYASLHTLLHSIPPWSKTHTLPHPATPTTLAPHREDQARFREWHLLCSKLLHVVGEVLRYTSIDVLEPLWCDMYARLVQAGNMDEVRMCARCAVNR